LIKDGLEGIWRKVVGNVIEAIPRYLPEWLNKTTKKKKNSRQAVSRLKLELNISTIES
jgi:hypothetical protein